MNTQLLFSISWRVLFLITLGACSKSNDKTSTLPVIDGQWRITYYWDRDQEETNKYTGYTFDFQTNDLIEVLVNGVQSTGTWLQGTDDSTNKLILTFSSNPLSELNEDWHVIEQSTTKIRLQHISGGDGHIDYLTFERN